MIKKVIGIVVALAAIVVIVVASMHSDRYTSLLFGADGLISPVDTLESVMTDVEQLYPHAAPSQDQGSVEPLDIPFEEGPVDSLRPAADML